MLDYNTVIILNAILVLGAIFSLTRELRFLGLLTIFIGFFGLFSTIGTPEIIMGYINIEGTATPIIQTITEFRLISILCLFGNVACLVIGLFGD